MKRKTVALILALSMCLSLLSACGSGNTATDDKPSESENAASSTEQQPAESEKPEESKEQPEESENPKEEEPEESAEPTQEEPKEEHAGTKLLALLQEEYQNGFVEGERPGYTYYTSDAGMGLLAFISNGVVYIWDVEYGNEKVFSYDIASKSLSEVEIRFDVEAIHNQFFVMNDTVCALGTGGELLTFDYNGVLQKTVTGQVYLCQFDKGILVRSLSQSPTMFLYSYDLEKIAEIPTTVQREGAHGIKEDVQLKLRDSFNIIVANGTVYATTEEGPSAWYRLNTDTYEWEVPEPVQVYGYGDAFCGKYVIDGENIYDMVTGEKVFNCNEAGVYPPASWYSRGQLCYFGGEKYLGCKNNEYRWVNLTDLTMSDPLKLPGEGEYILNDTYCVYRDQYGWFLWNYNTGEEETIMLFEQ